MSEHAPRERAATIAIALALVAGSVDAVALLQTGHYVSHMTGTTTHAMTRLGDGAPAVWTGLIVQASLAVAAFLTGAGVVGTALSEGRGVSPMCAAAAPIALESLAIAVGGLLMLPGVLHSPGAVCILPLAFAMGVQNATTTHLFGPWERTTHVTSNLTDLGAQLGARIRSRLDPGTGRGFAEPDGDTLASAALLSLGFAVGGALGTCASWLLGPIVGLCAAVPPAIVALVLGFEGAASPN